MRDQPYLDAIETIRQAPVQERYRATINMIADTRSQLESIRGQLEGRLNAINEQIARLDDEIALLKSIKFKA